MDQIVTEIVRAAPYMAITMFTTTMIWAREVERLNKEWSDYCTKLHKTWAESYKALSDRLREVENSQNVT